VNDACIALGIHRATCYRWMKSGALPFAEIAGIRFVRVSDIEKLLEPTAA
jgi:predicted site-specific integrase-resolvase